MSLYYKLDANHNVIRCADVMEWGRWFEDHDARRVGDTTVGAKRVSTVFLGLNHNFGESDDLIIFETMVFDADGQEEDCTRYRTWDEAARGHAEVVAKLREAAQSVGDS